MGLERGADVTVSPNEASQNLNSDVGRGSEDAPMQVTSVGGSSGSSRLSGEEAAIHPGRGASESNPGQPEVPEEEDVKGSERAKEWPHLGKSRAIRAPKGPTRAQREAHEVGHWPFVP